MAKRERLFGIEKLTRFIRQVIFYGILYKQEPHLRYLAIFFIQYTIYSMRNTLLITLSLILLSCSKDDKIAQAPFIGKWHTTEVTMDNILQDKWENMELTFSQSDLEGGEYHAVNSINDSIWKTAGTWKTSGNPIRFIRDDTVTVDYILRNDTLWIKKYLPWTVAPCIPDVDNPCVPAIAGEWRFILIRENQGSGS